MLSVAHRCSADVMRYTNLLYLGYQLVRPSDERLVKLKGKVAVLEKKDFAAWVAARTEKPTALTWNNKVLWATTGATVPGMPCVIRVYRER